MQTGAGEVAQQATVHAPKPDNLSLGPVQYMVGKQQLRSSPDTHLHSVAGATYSVAGHTYSDRWNKNQMLSVTNQKLVFNSPRPWIFW